jgi:hypothetical protein
VGLININGSKKFKVMARMVVVVKHNNRFMEVDLVAMVGNGVLRMSML